MRFESHSRYKRKEIGKGGEQHRVGHGRPLATEPWCKGSVFGCDIVVWDDKEDASDSQELTRDLMALLASFYGKYYGRKRLERRKQNKK